MSPVITVAIMTYNAEQYIVDVLSHLKRVRTPAFNTLIIDDHSTDKTVSLAQLTMPSATIVVNAQNEGHSASCNHALELCNTRYLLLLDHDVLVQPDFLSPLLEALQSDENIAVATSVIKDYTGKYIYGTDLHYLIAAIFHRKEPESDIKKIGIAATTSVLLDLVKVDETRFDERFFIYNNDFDFFYSLRMKGHEIVTARKSQVLHLTGTTELSNRGGRNYSSMRAYFNTRNRIFFIIKNLQLRTIIVLAPIMVSQEIFAMLIYLLKGFWGVYPKISWSLINNSHYLLRQRRILKKTRVIGDKTLLQTGIYDIQEDVLPGQFGYILKQIIDKICAVYWIVAKLAIEP